MTACAPSERGHDERHRDRGLTLGFGVTLFASAALLFCVEPMVARMLMPLLGGAPAVWITCMLFFQAALLLGYAYAHASIAWLGVRRQAALHLVVVLLPFAVLPIHVRPDSVAALGHAGAPVLPLLGVLAVTVGLPFFVVGATAPLVQKWFSRVSTVAGADPYFLYGASNLGSLLSLAAYPAVIEPWLGLSLQSRLWAWGYGLLAILVGSAAVVALVRAGPEPARALRADTAIAPRLTVLRRVRWVAYAAVPSSLLLGVTAYITSDVAPIPLFWVVPLALYLLTFILVFARRPPLAHAPMVRALPFGVTATVMMLLVQASTPMPLILVVHVATFFVAAMVCHGELARDRPTPEHLTEFYLWVSVGGVVGGIANGLLAPWVFDHLIEYPLALVLAAACRRVAGESTRPRDDAGFTAGILVLTLGVVALGNALHLDPAGHYFTLLFAAPLFLTYGQLHHPRRYALCMAATLAGGVFYDASIGHTLHVERTFYGIVSVTRDLSSTFVQLAHGNTIHGRQRQGELRHEPTAYYTRGGPLGPLMDELHARTPSGARVAVVGLGAGAMAAYARPDEAWTYYEINPSVVRIASDPRYFTFLADAFGDSPRLRMVVGDARLRLESAPDAAYDLLVVDAFSSDAIPAHLLTREAFTLYLAKLRPRGLLALHISNRYLDLAPVLSSLAADGGLEGLLRRDREPTDPRAADVGWTPSDWAVLLRRGDVPLVLKPRDGWAPFEPARGPPWTDDFSDIVRAIHW